ncbi:MAG TPA: hypothetical protein VG845_05195 [Dehalococcoidia bacterium]|jgi:hypothetical protein|nr:hypothetical protein [Dehalococcoidia bacterium]
MNDRQVSWQTTLGSILDADLLRELDGSQPAPDDPAVVVYLTTGDVQEIRPVSSVSLTGESIVLLYGGAPIASYPRQDVSFCSRSRVAPFPC